MSIIGGKKLSLAQAIAIASEPHQQSQKSKRLWEAYVKKTKGKKCKEGFCHTEDDSEDATAIYCVVCNKEIGIEYWSCFCCNKDFCEDHMQNHEQLNGRDFDDD